MANCFNPHTIHTHIRDRHLWQLIMMPGFEEHMSTFSQEMRALNPVRIVVMEVLVYDMCGRGGGCVLLTTLNHIYFGDNYNFMVEQECLPAIMYVLFVLKDDHMEKWPIHRRSSCFYFQIEF